MSLSSTTATAPGYQKLAITTLLVVVVGLVVTLSSVWAGITGAHHLAIKPMSHDVVPSLSQCSNLRHATSQCSHRTRHSYSLDFLMTKTKQLSKQQPSSSSSENMKGSSSTIGEEMIIQNNNKMIGSHIAIQKEKLLRVRRENERLRQMIHKLKEAQLMENEA